MMYKIQNSVELVGIYILKVFAFPLFLLCFVSFFFFSTSGTTASKTQVWNVDTLQEN